jgi:hypothetical protein
MSPNIIVRQYLFLAPSEFYIFDFREISTVLLDDFASHLSDIWIHRPFAGNNPFLLDR